MFPRSCDSRTFTMLCRYTCVYSLLVAVSIRASESQFSSALLVLNDSESQEKTFSLEKIPLLNGDHNSSGSERSGVTSELEDFTNSVESTEVEKYIEGNRIFSNPNLETKVILLTEAPSDVEDIPYPVQKEERLAQSKDLLDASKERSVFTSRDVSIEEPTSDTVVKRTLDYDSNVLFDSYITESSTILMYNSTLPLLLDRNTVTASGKREDFTKSPDGTTDTTIVTSVFDKNSIRSQTSRRSYFPISHLQTLSSEMDSFINTAKETRFENVPKPEKLFSPSRENDDDEKIVVDRILKKNYSSNVQSTDVLYGSKFNADHVYIDSLLKDRSIIKKEKYQSGVLFEDCSHCDVRILPIKALEQRSTPKTEEESIPPSKIAFAVLPEGKELQINSLGLSDGIFIFSYISEFLSWIQPNDFPVELLKNALKQQMTWTSLIMQSLQVEAGFVACLVAGVLLALAVPVVVLSHACYRMGERPEDSSEDKGGWAGNCRRRTLVFVLQLLLVLLCAGMVAMFVTNEQLSAAVVQSSEVAQTALNDVSTFVHNSHLQLHFLLTKSVDQVLQAVFADLDNVDTLLGRPIQRELVRETGLDVALDTLSDMTKDAKLVTQQVDRFIDEVRTTQELLTSSREKLSDLRQQVELFRRACGPRDRAMCDSIDASGLEVTFKLDRIKTDERFNRMKRMGGVGLELAVTEAKDHFLAIPSRVEADTRDAREGVRRQLTRQRTEVDELTVALERLARDLTSKVGEARFQAGYWTQDLDQHEYWRWIVCLGGGAAVLMIWLLLLCSMCCGCCGSERAAGPTILVTIVLMCLFSTALWTLAILGLLVGGHAEVFLCRPLYDEPEFRVLSRLVDQPGVFYDQPSGGFIGNVVYGNNTIDVPLKQILQDCRDSRPVYPALRLHRVMDVEAAVGQGQWGDVTSHLRAIKANLSHMEVLSPALMDQLGDLLSTLSANFTEHRIQMSKPVTGKDLDSFARQLDNIGNQLRDLATASRMETLSSRTRRLIDSHIRPLEGRKDALVYQLTTLEVHTQPLQRQVNQSLSHLKTIQFFINSQGEAIAQRKSREFSERLLSYIEQLRGHVTGSAKDMVASCRPIWDIFNNSRLFLCRHTVDPLNGFWFATMWCLLVLLVATPVCLKLVDYYKHQGGKSTGSPSDLVSSEQGGGWSTPGYDIKGSKESTPGGA